MKKITQMFPRVGINTVVNTLGKHHIRIEEPEKTLFSDVNLVIGPNGAGKTRLLNALLELYQNVQHMEVLYGYFPALSSSRPQPLATKSGEDPPWEFSLREYQSIDDISFEDFFKEIEAQGEEFLCQLLVHRSQYEKSVNQRMFRQIAQFFSEFTGKELVMGQELTVKDSNSVQVSLAEAMERLSPGERMLFYMSIFFALKRDGKRKRVIILDEPESHLHPKALLGFVKALAATFPGATVWIATHSLFLLPEFEFENIVYMENGKVLRRHSDLYRKALAGLLGEGNENVSRFFASLPHWQYYEFISECFTNPTVVSTVNPKDEQVRIFIDALKKHEITRVLDCGGGSGRLGLSMMEASVAEWQNVTYDIYDAWPSYTGRKFKVYKQLENVPGNYNCIVMMNFLHEVPPQEWSSWFQKLYTLMAPGGYLLFVEVEALQTGECPNDTGYLVLGYGEIAALFDTVDLSVIRLGDKQKSVGMLVAWEYLHNVSDETVSTAIRVLEMRAYEELCKMRKSENLRRVMEKEKPPLPSADEQQRKIDARRYAFFSQQYINAKLFNDGEKKPLEDNKSLQAPVSLAVPVPPEKKKLLMALLEETDALLANAALSKNTQREAISGTFRNAVASYLAKGYVSERRRMLCRDMIGAVEAISSDKRLIGNLLQIGSLLGDKTCTGRLIKEGYPVKDL